MIDINAIAEAARATSRTQDRPKAEMIYSPLYEQKQIAAQRLDVYREYQKNIRKAGMLRADIVKGVAAGDDALVLLLMACECIGYMTGDSAFSSIMRKRLKEREDLV